MAVEYAAAARMTSAASFKFVAVIIDSADLSQIFRRRFAGQLTIFFKDLRIPDVRPLSGHIDHFHVEFK
jgi:hypothetical protein